MFTPHVFSPFALPLFLYLVSLGAAALAVAGITCVALRATRRAPLPLRHTLGVVGLVVALASPILVALIEQSGLSLIAITSSVETVDAVANATESTRATSSLSATTAPAVRVDSHDQTLSDSVQDAALAPANASPAAPVISIETPDTLAVAPPARFSAMSVFLWTSLVLAIVWALGSLRQAFLLWRGVRQVRLLLRHARPVEDARILEIARRATTAVGLDRAPLLLASSLVETPVSLGVFRPCVVLSDSQRELWSAEAWHALLVHEMAHIARRDLFVGWLQRLGAVLYWWNPLLHRVSAEISLVREQICDDLVARHAGASDSYAELIVELAARVADRRTLAPALGVSDGSPHDLADRLRRILNPGRVIVTELDARGTFVTAMFGLVLLLSLSGTSFHLATARAADDEKQEATNVAAAEQPAEQPSPAADADTVQSPLLKKRVRVLDPQGKPIAGATVKPWAMQSSQGHGPWMKDGFGASDPPVLTTDAEGFATIPFPKYALAAEQVPIRELTCEVSHPDFAATQYNNVPVEGPTASELSTIHLHPGAVITALALEGDRLLPMEFVRAQWSNQGQQSAKLDAEGRLALPRVPAGKVKVRLAYFAADGSVMFSPVQDLTVNDGERRDLRLKLEPALRVAGQLDASVPRPVKNGRVVSEIFSRGDTFTEQLQWRGCATVEADGSFVIERVPRGDLQVIALCDGFMAHSGDGSR